MLLLKRKPNIFLLIIIEFVQALKIVNIFSDSGILAHEISNVDIYSPIWMYIPIFQQDAFVKHYATGSNTVKTAKLSMVQGNQLLCL